MVACGVTYVASFLRPPARRDLRWLSGGLILGVLGEAVLGAVVVYSKLNAYVVMTHFMLGIALLSVSVVLCLRADHGPGRGTLVVTRRVLLLTRAYLVLLVVAVAAGTATTGAGPHAGGKGAKRVAIGLSDMTRIHAEAVWVTAIVLLVILYTLWKSDAPAHVQESGRILLGVMVVQGMIGYTQYITHLPSLLVGIHVVGATMVVSTALWFHHGLSDHLPEVVDGGHPGRSRHRPDRRRRAGPRAGMRLPSPRRRRAARAGGAPSPIPGGTGRMVPGGVVPPETAPVGDVGTITDQETTSDRPWLVIVWNDPINLMSFVTFVLQKLFGYSKEKATSLMLDIHTKGRAVVSSGTRERAELDVYRLHEHGLWATMEQSG